MQKDYFLYGGCYWIFHLEPSDFTTDPDLDRTHFDKNYCANMCATGEEMFSVSGPIDFENNKNAKIKNIFRFETSENIGNNFYNIHKELLESDLEVIYLGGFWFETSVKKTNHVKWKWDEEFEDLSQLIFGRYSASRFFDWIWMDNQWKNWTDGMFFFA